MEESIDVQPDLFLFYALRKPNPEFDFQLKTTAAN
jgi:hypothetical protein